MKAVILAEKDVQDEEYIYPYYRLQEEGFELDVAVTNCTEKVVGKYGIPIKANISFNLLWAENYDLVVIPGGWAPEKMRMNSYVLNFVKKCDEMGKVIAAICHGPQVLISAGIVKGRKVTGYVGIKDDITNAGATYVDAGVVVDGNLVTSPHYKNNPEFMRETLAKFKGCCCKKTLGL